MISPPPPRCSNRTTTVGALGEALEVPESDVRVSDSGAIAIATAPDVVRARDRAHRVSSVLQAP